MASKEDMLNARLRWLLPGEPQEAGAPTLDGGAAAAPAELPSTGAGVPMTYEQGQRVVELLLDLTTCMKNIERALGQPSGFRPQPTQPAERAVAVVSQPTSGVSAGASGGPSRSTSLLPSASGPSNATKSQSHATSDQEFDYGVSNLSVDDVDAATRCGICHNACQEIFVLDSCGHYPYCSQCVTKLKNQKNCIPPYLRNDNYITTN